MSVAEFVEYLKYKIEESRRGVLEISEELTHTNHATAIAHCSDQLLRRAAGIRLAEELLYQITMGDFADFEAVRAMMVTQLVKSTRNPPVSSNLGKTQVYLYEQEMRGILLGYDPYAATKALG
jgi:hypothetical protein